MIARRHGNRYFLCIESRIRNNERDLARTDLREVKTPIDVGKRHAVRALDLYSSTLEESTRSQIADTSGDAARSSDF